MPSARLGRAPSRPPPGRVPDLAIIGGLLPVAVLVQVVIADHVRGNVATRNGIGIARVARFAETVEIVRRRQALDGDVGQCAVVETVGLPGLHRAADAVLAVDGARALEHGHHRAVAVRRDIHAIGAGLAGDKRHGGRVHLVGLAALDPAHAQVQRALGQFHLGGGVVEVEEVECAVVVDAQRRIAQLQGGAAVIAGQQAVAGDQRAIDVGAAPVILSRRREFHVAGRVGEPGDAIGRVDLGVLVLRGAVLALGDTLIRRWALVVILRVGKGG